MSADRIRPALEVRDLRKSFSGLEVLKGVSTEVLTGEVRALIGPNGAGKTTLINTMTGIYSPSAGAVVLGGQDITGVQAFKIARRGLIRTYQIASLFLGLTVLENVAVASHAANRFSTDLESRQVNANHHAREVLGLVGIAHLGPTTASDISHGDQRLLELAIALSLRPKVLLLDEPTAGMSAAETGNFTKLLNQRLRGAYTIVLVEHDMQVVMNTADTISVLALGRVIAEGSPTAIRADAAVQEAYLGSAYA